MVENPTPADDEKVDEEQWLDDTGVPALKAWMQNSLSRMSFDTILNFAKFNRIGPDGKYADPGPVHQRTWAGTSGSSAQSELPLQASLCLTWRSNDATRGLASKGRIYAPRPAIQVGADGLFGTSTALGCAQAAAALINSLDASLGPIGSGTIRPYIVSGGLGAKAFQVDYVTVDNRIDIQRRRANAQNPSKSRAEVNY